MIRADETLGNHPTISLGCGALCTFNYDTLISSAVGDPRHPRGRFLAALEAACRRARQGPRRLRVRLRVACVISSRRTSRKSALHHPARAHSLSVQSWSLTGSSFCRSAWCRLSTARMPTSTRRSPLALVVIVVVQWYSVQSLLEGLSAPVHQPFELPWPARIIFIPLNIIEEVTKPVTLAMRLFGNIFAGTAIIGLIVGFSALSCPGWVQLAGRSSGRSC